MPEAHRDTRAIGRWAAGWLACLVTLTAGSTATADRITIRGGGQIRGKLIPDKEQPGQLLFIGEVGKTPMAFKKEQIVQVAPEKGPLDEYILRLVKDRPTARDEFDLGAWCDENKLPDLAQLHYEQAVKRDSLFEEAHKRLGHVLMDGRWLNSEELKEAQGLVKFKGHWMTPEEKERRELVAATAAESNSWVKKLRLYRDAYLNGPPERTREAERRLLAIDEPVAVGPVLKVLGDDPLPILRALAAKVLGAIPGAAADRALVGRLFGEDDEIVREGTMAVLARRDASEVIPLLSKGLRSAHHEVVNRSAWGLGQMNAAVAVPRLIPALVTFEYDIVMADGGPASGGGINFNAVSPSPGFQNYTGVSVPVLTGPVVGPGSVAFGATSVPFAANGGASMGSGGSRGPSPRVVQIEHHNGEVLAALVKMTGRDFGYDIPTWKRWVATSFKVEATPSRRVREP